MGVGGATDTHHVELAWPAFGTPRYLIRVGLRDDGAEFRCVSFHVTALNRRQPIGATLLRDDVPAGRVISEAIQTLLRERLADAQREQDEPSLGAADVTLYERDPADGHLVNSRPLTEDEAEDFLANRRAYHHGVEQQNAKRLEGATGRGHGRRYPPGHLERVAKIASEARREAKPMGAAVAAAFGISASAAHNQINRARRRGLFDNDREGE